MTALPQDAVADLQQRIADLERQLEAAVNERDTAIERQTASALVNFRLKNELRGVTDRQKASAEILNAIANTEGDAEHALQRIAETTANFFSAAGVTIRIAEGDEWVQTVRVGAGPLATGAQPAADIATGGHNVPGTVYQENRQIHIPDLDNIDPSMAHWPATAARAAGIRTICGTPLRRGEKAVGALIVYRDRLAAFTDDELALQQSFADQAVIAIENARLFNETKEALERQTATADILKVIASSPSDVQPVFNVIVERAVRLCGGRMGRVYRYDSGVIQMVAGHGLSATGLDKVQQVFPRPATDDTIAGQVMLSHRPYFVTDIQHEDSVPPLSRQMIEALGTRSQVTVPMLRTGQAIGAITVGWADPGAFGDQQVSLLQTFADQAVIAIENVRLFRETQEALERQTATSDILKVIASSPSDVQPVFDAIADSANRLLGGFSSTVFRFVDGMAHLKAFTPTTPEADEVLRSSFPVPVTSFAPFRAMQSGEVVQIPDTEAPTYELQTISRTRGYRSMVWAPLMNKGESIGFIAVTRVQPGSFVDHHIQLLQTFADQAVIAIENARLFNETQEALERQTATSDILKVIASSPSDVQPVFDAIATSANRLLGGFSTAVFRFLDDNSHLAAFTPISPAADEMLKSSFPRPIAGFAAQELAHEGKTVQIPDTEDSPRARDLAQALGFRSMVFVPLVSDMATIGYISVTRAETGSFVDHHIQLLQTFADQAVIAIENARLFNETQEALERQTATADILKVIASSPSEVQPVFDAILSRALHLCEAAFGFLTTHDGERFAFAAQLGVPPALAEHFLAGMDQPRPGDAHWRLLDGEDLIHNLDQKDEDAYRSGNPLRRAVVDIGGARSALVVALRNSGSLRGSITIYRKEVRPFSTSQIALLRHFADQAVIAIENTRLFNETQEALERQTATADILKVIASSPSDTRPVFEAIASSAKRLLGGLSAAVFRIIDGTVHVAAFTSINPTADAALKADFPRPVEGFEGFQLALSGKPFVIPDTEERKSGTLPEVARLHGFRSMLYVPLMSGSIPFGIITVTRAEPGGFPPHHIQLLQTFADQAVIAIENTRLFNEVQERTIELTEALEQQTATAEVLGVISSSAGDLAPVFDAMLGKAMQLCSANFGVLSTYDGKAFHTAATYGLPPAYDEYRRRHPQEYGPGTAPARLLQGEPFVEIGDLAGSAAYRNGEPNRRALVDLGGARCVLAVPLVKDERVIGLVMIFRQEDRPFSEKQIALLQQFAAQAVIAIENTRLLRELRESTEDLSESLQQQTATADLLQVISRSAFDLQPIFDAIAERSVTLCGADRAFIYRFDGESLRMAAAYNASPDFKQWMEQHPIPLDRHSGSGRAALERRTVHIHDVRADPEYTFGAKEVEDIRTILGVRILKGDELLGVMMIFHLEVRPFTEKQIALVETFADQAAIAIENVRLFDQLQHRTDDLAESLQQQTATSEVLQIISSSPGDLAPVFDKMLENATKVCGAGFGSMVLVEGDMLRQAAFYNAPAALAAVRTNAVRPLHPLSGIATAVRDKRVVQTEDIRNSPAYLAGARHAVELAELGGARTLVVVPMLREDEAIGVITVYRQEVRSFGDKQVELLTNFARQAVIAIENARLLRELRQRTDDLTEALVYQTGSSNILKVIASSPTDVGPALKAIVDSACEICDAYDAVVLLKEGDDLRLSAHHGAIPFSVERLPINRQWVTGRAVVDKTTQHIPDVHGPEGDDLPDGRELARQQGHRTVLSVPLLRDNEAIGAIALRRIEVHPFNDKQIELLKSFADQAVIAISNVRLFEQVQQRTRELTKSLDDLRTAQDRLVQTEKLASLGQLTAGIAHEIKNPLNFVNNFAALSVELTDELNDILKQVKIAEQLRKEVDELTGLLKDNLSKVVQHGKRADSIVKNMLLHSREGTGEHRPADVNALVDESLNLAYHGARAEKPQFNVTLQRDFDPQAGTADVFPQEITRVLLNLISNGFYAVTKRKADNGGGDFEPQVTATTRGSDDHVEIRIRDNGTGIPPEVKEKMFNPFFTTKPAGEGTGLGLSMSHDIIVKQHGGTIEVATEAGAFTEFRLVLPRTSLARANGNR